MATPLSSFLNPIKSKEYTLISDNKTFKIKISLSSDILIDAIELNKINAIFYSNIFSLETLFSLSKGFKICENINEAYDIIEGIFEIKKSSIKCVNDNEILLIIMLDLPGGKFQEVNLKLNKKEVNKHVIIEELVKKVNQLEEDNKMLNNEITQLKEKFNKFEKLFKTEIENKEMIEKKGIDSKIIDNINSLEMIINQLFNNYPNLKQKKVNFDLLYRATKDGDNKVNFHQKINNKKSTLSIIETTKGFKFGVYLEVPFNNLEKSVNDDKCFIFSLDLKKIYNGKKSKYHINDFSDNFFNLYNQPICIVDNCISNNSSYSCSKSNADASFCGFEKDYELNNSEKYFTVKEMETFQVSFI